MEGEKREREVPADFAGILNGTGGESNVLEVRAAELRALDMRDGKVVPQRPGRIPEEELRKIEEDKARARVKFFSVFHHHLTSLFASVSPFVSRDCTDVIYIPLRSF